VIREDAEMKDIRQQYGDGYRKAFTLVELLVVIAIIALLLSIMMPALNSAREQGRSAVCKSHLRSVGLALPMYINDSQGFMPPYSTDRIDSTDAYTFQPTGLSYNQYVRYTLLTAWSSTSTDEEPPRSGDGFLGPYMGDVKSSDILKKALGCQTLSDRPTIKKLLIRGAPRDCYVYRAKSYALNYVYTTALVNYKRVPMKAEKIRKPSNLVFMVDGAGNQPFIVPANMSYYSEPREKNTYYVPSIRHAKKFNMVFCDGHVESGGWSSHYTIENFQYYYSQN
jgi:prepilin-type N-terminal cleavage/methylation domain-containing protein/prepilin-type processing-associated H-X9-DG protein